ncbi:MAG: hypothetical protein N2258_05505 [Brevinematales bacterium]|nr:hypothetical protein [Brevinematales bacterium]
MSFKILKVENEKVCIGCDNVISLWNVLKYMVEMPYLYSFYIENYEGGNTLIPEELWKEEGITYKKLKKGVYLFPYNSINFILEDSIHNVDIYVVSENSKNFKSEYEMFFSVKNTEEFFIEINAEKINTFLALYFFSLLKLGYDNSMFEGFKLLWKKNEILKFNEIEYISSSFQIGLKGFHFIVKMGKDNEVEYYKIDYEKGKFKKELLKEDKSLNPGMIKKKFITKNVVFAILYYSLIPILLLLIYFFKKKWLILILIIYIALKIGYSVFKKNIYRIFK